MTAGTSAPASGAFGRTLATIRHSRTPYLSQSRLAEAAGFDHSYISRCETGTREPSRAAVMAIATALQATPDERDRLLEAGGFKALGGVDTDPLAAELDAMLRDPALPDMTKHMLRASVEAAMWLARARADQERRAA